MEVLAQSSELQQSFEDQVASASGLNANLATILSACEEKKVVVMVDEDHGDLD